MYHVGILAHSAEGAALSYRAFCHTGFQELGPHEHPDVTMDSIAFARTLPALMDGDYDAVTAVLGASADRLARAGADFFICPDNTAHISWRNRATASRYRPFTLQKSLRKPRCEPAIGG